tara:strand:+ start:416 stop:637 length:222 start_codon:yes stop_codon:yes gene_type:complete
MRDCAPIIPFTKREGDLQMTNLTLSYNELLIILEMLRKENDVIASEQERLDLKTKLINAIADSKAVANSTYEI